MVPTACRSSQRRVPKMRISTTFVYFNEITIKKNSYIKKQANIYTQIDVILSHHKPTEASQSHEFLQLKPSVIFVTIIKK